MRVRDLISTPLKSLHHAERYVNDGSPSGFTAFNRTSSPTDPYGANDCFNLFILKDSSCFFEIYGTPLSNSRHIYSDYMFIHPDMIQHPDLKQYPVMEFDGIKVVPTSSSRTVQIVNEAPFDYVKLYYDGIVGRNNRKLYRIKAIAGPEVSNLILEAINSCKLNSSLSILHEPYAKLHINPKLSKDDHWAMIWREYIPRGFQASQISFILPFFSLWSTDMKNQKDDIILKQLIDIWARQYKEYVIENIIFRVIDIYFEMIIKLGLLFEFNAQNVLLGFDSDFKPISIILRDMMDTEKDITIRTQLGLETSFQSFPYHVIAEEQGDFYQQRHSFSFDFKLCQYVLEPMIDTCSKLGVLDRTRTINDVKHYLNRWIRCLPDSYFPNNGKWYFYNKVLVDKEKILIANDSPLFR